MAPQVILDSRLAIFHEEDAWLALADLHIGYEIERRHAGGLFPLWGQQSIKDRLCGLIEDHAPRRVIIVGDLVDGRVQAGQEDAISLLEEIGRLGAEAVLVRGNHDRGLILRQFPWTDHHEEDGFVFSHGHLPPPEGASGVVVCGHLHPGFRYSDGAGTRIRLPAFAQDPRFGDAGRWVLPAFSPWTTGGHLKEVSKGGRLWPCAEGTILPPIDL